MSDFPSNESVTALMIVLVREYITYEEEIVEEKKEEANDQDITEASGQGNEEQREESGQDKGGESSESAVNNEASDRVEQRSDGQQEGQENVEAPEEDTLAGEKEQTKKFRTIVQEKCKFVVRTLPIANFEADWKIATFIIKKPENPENNSFEDKHNCLCLPVLAVAKLSQLISKVYMPAISRKSDLIQNREEGKGADSKVHQQDIVSLINKLSMSLSNSMQAIQGDVELEIPDVSFEGFRFPRLS